MTYSARRRFCRAVALLSAALALAFGPAQTVAQDRTLIVGVGTLYNDLSLNAYTLLQAAGKPVDRVLLTPTSPLLPNLGVYEQIWVLDFSPEADSYASAYRNIADWYKASPKDLIADARIMNSLGLIAGAVESQLILNYYENFAAGNGGLLLGTDDDAFQEGINDLNALIGLQSFNGLYYSIPFKATVDPKSPLMSYPSAAYGTGDGIIEPSFYVMDNSASGNVPYSLQPNGSILYPVAWHFATGTLGDPTISTTLRFAPNVAGVPEPTTVGLFAVALAGLGFSRRKLASNTK